MGADKALLPYRGRTLAEHIAAAVAEAAGSVMLIGNPGRYGHLGLPVTADLRPGLGPLSGIETALSLKKGEWNLIVACDLPKLPADIFGELIATAGTTGADCVVPVSEEGPQPLAALWRDRSLAAVRAALDQGRLRVAEAVANIHWLPVSRSRAFDNMNTPEEWSAFLKTD